MHQIVPDPTGGAHSAPSNPLAGKGEGKEEEQEGEGSEGRLPPLKFKSGSHGLRVMLSIHCKSAGLC